jgi:hypothetical protein
VHYLRLKQVVLTALPLSDARPEWRRLRSRLWVGRSDDQPIGQIEHGRRYTYTDADGRTFGRFRTLEAAQTAATGPIPIVAPGSGGLGSARSQGALLWGSSAAAAVAVALVVVGSMFVQ